jgi:hypothetical protein
MLAGHQRWLPAVTGVLPVGQKGVIANYRLSRPDSAFTPVNVRMARYTAGPGSLRLSVAIPDWRRVS